MAERAKAPREVRKLRFNLAPLMSAGALLQTVQGFASRQVLSSTTLAAGITAEDTTIVLNDDPGVGAVITIDPGSIAAEEIFKVTAVVPSGSDFSCDILPPAEVPHSNGASVDYYPGVNSRFLVDDTPTPLSSGLVTFLAQQGADAQTYLVSVLGTCNNGETVEDETELDVIEFSPVTPITKQPAETRDLFVNFEEWTSLYETT
jgi:hypothetical protein